MAIPVTRFNVLPKPIFLIWGGKKVNWSKSGIRKLEHLENVKIFLCHIVHQNNPKLVRDWMNKCVMKIGGGTEKF